MKPIGQAQNAKASHASHTSMEAALLGIELQRNANPQLADTADSAPSVGTRSTKKPMLLNRLLMQRPTPRMSESRAIPKLAAVASPRIKKLCRRSSACREAGRALNPNGRPALRDCYLSLGQALPLGHPSRRVGAVG